MTDALRYVNIVLASVLFGMMLRESRRLWWLLTLAARLKGVSFAALVGSIVIGTVLVLAGAPDIIRVLLLTASLGIGITAYLLSKKH